MRSREADHAHFRQLISARLDGPLNVIVERQLLRHLARCAECRAVQNDYHDQRRQLRSLGLAPPPRDMWARTAAALDREVARRPPRSEADERRWLPRTTVVMAAAALGVALAVGSTQLSVVPPTVEASPRPGQPTPFGVLPQRISLLGTDANGLVLFRTDVDQVCPPTAPACIDDDDISPQLIALPRSVVPINVTISPDGERVAITGRHGGRDGVLALVPAIPSGLPTSEPTLDPRTPAPTPDQTTTQPDPSPGTGASQPPALPTVAASPAASAHPSAPPVPALAAVAVLDDVHVIGAPPAWSAEGDLLAFSAMPADRSRGPDVYVWREGDEVAQPLTLDNSTYFASWTGRRIVASRIARGADDVPVGVETVVIDIDSGEERTLATSGLWLPVVAPQAERAVAWQGQLDVRADSVQPLAGALYLIDWQALDPFADDSDWVAADTASPAPATVEPSAGGHPGRGPSARPSPGQRPMLTLPPDDDPGATPAPRETPADEESPAPTPEPVALEALALEAWRDPLVEPVLDWQVRWSTDGQALGYWIGDAAGASWGRLSVVDVAALIDSADAEPLLPAVLARRHFTLGLDRVAWIAPADTQPEGEVRIRTWGVGGEGGLRMPSFDMREVVPAF